VHFFSLSGCFRVFVLGFLGICFSFVRLGYFVSWYCVFGDMGVFGYVFDDRGRRWFRSRLWCFGPVLDDF